MDTRRLRTKIGLAALISGALLVTGCDNVATSTAKKPAKKTGISSDAPPAAVEGEVPGTPMAERVAVIGLLNKRNGETRDFELKPGQAVRLGKVVIRVRACERTAPWETYPDQGAFVQLIIRERPRGTNQAERWAQVFSGWLFKENVAANVVQHPIYDIWVKECKMSFPGEEPNPEDLPKAPTAGAATDASSGSPNKAPSNRPQTPSRPAPVVEPEVEEEDETGGEAEGESTVET